MFHWAYSYDGKVVHLFISDNPTDVQYNFNILTVKLGSRPICLSTADAGFQAVKAKNLVDRVTDM